MNYLRTFKKNIIRIAVVSLLLLSMQFVPAYAQTPASIEAVNNYLNKYGFTDGYSNEAERAIWVRLVQFIGNGSITSLKELPPQASQILTNAATRQNLVNSVAKNVDRYGADPNPDMTVVHPTTDPTKDNFQLAPSTCFGSGEKATVDIKNYGGCGWKDLIQLLNTVIKFMVYIAASLSAIAFAYAGFLYMTAFGQSGKIEQAHGIFSKTLTGIFFVLLGWLLVATILKVMGVDQAFSLLNMSGVKELSNPKK